MNIEIKILDEEYYKCTSIYPPMLPGDTTLDTVGNLPKYATLGSGAIDLICTEDVAFYPYEIKLINTGLAIHIGSSKHHTDYFDYVGLILPRSGLGSKGLILANTVGLIDGDYQGELKISAWNRNHPQDGNLETDKITLKAGNRFAQLMFIPTVKASWVLVDEFTKKTDRGEGGFNSTGA